MSQTETGKATAADDRTEAARADNNTRTTSRPAILPLRLVQKMGQDHFALHRPATLPSVPVFSTE